MKSDFISKEILQQYSEYLKKEIEGMYTRKCDCCGLRFKMDDLPTIPSYTCQQCKRNNKINEILK